MWVFSYRLMNIIIDNISSCLPRSRASLSEATPPLAMTSVLLSLLRYSEGTHPFMPCENTHTSNSKHTLQTWKRPQGIYTKHSNQNVWKEVLWNLSVLFSFLSDWSILFDKLKHAKQPSIYSIKTHQDVVIKSQDLVVLAFHVEHLRLLMKLYQLLFKQ